MHGSIVVMFFWLSQAKGRLYYKQIIRKRAGKENAKLKEKKIPTAQESK